MDEIPAPAPGRPPVRVNCPECTASLAGTYERCPHCELPLRGPVASELWRLDRELDGLRAREAGLLARRAHLLGLLGAERARLAQAGRVASPPHPEPSPAATSTPVPAHAVPASAVASAPLTAPTAPFAPVPAPGAGVPKEVSPRAVQNLLLGLGGLLLVVAAVVFTVVSWGSMGIGGRATVLAVVTGLAFAAPVLLVRRGLVTTAETIAMFGVALLFLDGYAARHTGLAGADELTGPHYAALLFTLVALATAGYARLLPLRLPLPVAIVVAQFPLFFLAFDETAQWITAALAATAAADAAFLLLGTAHRSPARVPVPVPDSAPSAGSASDLVPGPGAAPGSASDPVPGPGVTPGSASGPASGPEISPVPGPGVTPGSASGTGPAPGPWSGPRTTVAVCFAVLWGLGVCHGTLAVLLQQVLGQVNGIAISMVWGALLIALAVTGLAVARRTEHGGRLTVVTAVSTLTLTVGLAAPVRSLLPYTWEVVPYTVAALAAVAVMLRAPGLDEPRLRSAGAVSGGVLAAATALPFADAVTLTLFARWEHARWGATGFADAWPAVPFPQFPVVAAMLALAAAWAAHRGRPLMGFAALAAGTLAVAVAPVAFGWGHRVDLVVLPALAVVLVAAASLAARRWWAWAFAAAAGTVSAEALATALTGRASTYAVLAVLLVAWGVAAYTARVRPVAAFSLVMGVLSVTGLAWAVCAGSGWTSVGDGLSLSLGAGAVLAALLVLPVLVPAAASPESPAGDDPRRPAGLVLSGVLALLAVLSVAPALAAIGDFHDPILRPWTFSAGPGGRHPLLVAVMILVAAAAVLVSWRVARRPGATRAALLAGPLVLVSLPISVALPYGVEVALFVAGTLPPAWAAARSRAAWAFGGVAALWTAYVAISWALMSETATLVVLPVLAVIAVAVALGSRRGVALPGRAGVPLPGQVAVAFRDGMAVVAPVAAGVATLLAGGEVLAAGLALDRPVRYAAFGLLAVACAAAVLAGRFRRTPPAAGMEAAGYVLAVVALPLASADLPMASLACAVAGVLMAGTALRPDRRWAGYVGTGFLLLASWLRLLASDVTVIEAYTVPFSLVLLVIGFLRARRSGTSSWVAYGPGLASSLVPSLLALLGGSGWLRPLLLGVVSLAVLLVGARSRLQAPAVLGGLSLAVVALHELAPWIGQVVALMPRWVPMALGGLLLVAVGATYEARLGDVRRLRATLGRMR